MLLTKTIAKTISILHRHGEVHAHALFERLWARVGNGPGEDTLLLGPLAILRSGLGFRGAVVAHLNRSIIGLELKVKEIKIIFAKLKW